LLDVRKTDVTIKRNEEKMKEETRETNVNRKKEKEKEGIQKSK
jgi:hypothetical protein